LTLSYMTFTLPFTIWVLTTFMRAIPTSLEDAARIDGAGPFTILLRIFVPMLLPSMATTALLAFIAAWNEFLFALTFTLSERARTVPVAISQMSGASAHELPWGNIMAASVTVTLPLIALTLLFQRRIVSGLTAGSLKG
jgi:trehalose/maltose transport system permease protein